MVRNKKKLLQNVNFHYTLTRGQTEYMMAVILSNLWGPPKM